ncbi:MAG: Gfo/Idh/MocA family oxidoreductase [Pyrinomonadaceae bacterium]|nr:Gfo/Idh/MocA family oxidoreductase [Pyrinomonadaceae bacterium]
MKFGLIGCGAIGASRASSLQNTDKASLLSVFDSDASRRNEFAAKYSAKAPSSYIEMLEDDDLDTVIVSTPPNLHREHCIAAFEAGKHVLCEKPLASSVEDCRAIVDAANASGKVLGTGYNYRFYPAVAKARELISEGAIGEIVNVKSFAGHPGGKEFTHQWVHDPEIMGGGALMDNGIHLADLLLHFLGSADETHGFSSDMIWNFGDSEDNGFILAKTPEGRIGTLQASWSDWTGYKFHLEITGTNGGIKIHYPPMMTVHITRPTGTAKKGKRRIYIFPLFQFKERLRSYLWTIEQSFIAEQTDFMQRARGLGGVGATGIDGLKAVELVNAAYRQRCTHEKAAKVAAAETSSRAAIG